MACAATASSCHAAQRRRNNARASACCRRAAAQIVMRGGNARDMPAARRRVSAVGVMRYVVRADPSGDGYKECFSRRQSAKEAASTTGAASDGARAAREKHIPPRARTTRQSCAIRSTPIRWQPYMMRYILAQRAPQQRAPRGAPRAARQRRRSRRRCGYWRALRCYGTRFVCTVRVEETSRRYVIQAAASDTTRRVSIRHDAMPDELRYALNVETSYAFETTRRGTAARAPPPLPRRARHTQAAMAVSEVHAQGGIGEWSLEFD